MVNSKNGITSFLIQFGRLCLSIVGILMRLMANVVSVLASSIDISDSNDKSDVAPSGGVFNYRTGKLDDGMDPLGWYEKD